MTNETKKSEISARELAAKVDGGHEGMQVERGSTFGRSVAGVLYDKGWANYETHSYCTKASFEAHLKKGNRRVEIISSSFMGVFTIVRCSTDRE